MEIDYTLLFLGTIISVIGGLVGYKWVTLRTLDKGYVKDKIRLYEDMASEYKTEMLHWKGKYNQAKQGVYVQGDYDLSDVDNVEALIQEVLPQIKGVLPKNLQGLASDPKIAKIAIDLYKQNPEKAKELLSKFVKRGSKGTTNEESAPDWLNQANSEAL